MFLDGNDVLFLILLGWRMFGLCGKQGTILFFREGLFGGIQIPEQVSCLVGVGSNAKEKALVIISIFDGQIPCTVYHFIRVSSWVL